MSSRVLRVRHGIGKTAFITVIALLLTLIVGAGVALSGKTGTSNFTSTTSVSQSSSSTNSLQSASDLEDGKASCISLNGLPDPTCTPGATNSNVTQSNIYSTICVSGWTSTVRPPVSYTEPLKVARIQDYKYTDTNLGDYEEDHLIPLELGGSPTSVFNLWAQSHQGAYTSYQKDSLENYLNSQVCDGKLKLVDAQQEIATDWVRYWQLYIGSIVSSTFSSTSATSSSIYTTANATAAGQPLMVQITYAHNPIVRGNTQTIYMATSPAIGNAPVSVLVTYASGATQKTFNTQTGPSGQVSVSWTIGSNSDPGTFQVKVTVEGQTFSSSFQVNPST